MRPYGCHPPSGRRPGGSRELADLQGSQGAKLARLHSFQGKPTHRDPLELRDGVPHRLEHPLDLVVLAFVQRDLQPGVLSGLEHSDPVHRQAVALDVHSPPQAGQSVGVGDAVDLGVVDPRHFVTRMGDAFRERAVVGQEEEALGGDVQPPHGKEPGDFRDEVHHRLAALGIVAGRDRPLRLVEQEIDGCVGSPHPHAVEANVVTHGVSLGAELGHDLAVDGDPALGHRLLRPASRSEPRAGQDLLQSFFHAGIIPRGGGLSGPKGRPATGGGP